MAVNSAPTSFLDNSIMTAGHVLYQQSENVKRNEAGEIEMVEEGDDKVVEDNGDKGNKALKSHYASWTQAVLMRLRKFWRMYLLGVLVAQAGK